MGALGMIRFFIVMLTLIISHVSANAWTSSCNVDQIAAVRVCTLEGRGTAGKSFTIVYFNKLGPKIQVWHFDPLHQAAFRVDDAQPVIMPNINQFIFKSTFAAHSASARQLIAQMLKGKTLRWRQHQEIGVESEDVTISLEGFKEGYGKLQKLVYAQP